MYTKNIIWLRTAFCAIAALLIAACGNRQRVASLSDEAIVAAATSSDSAQSIYSRTDSSALHTEEDHARYDVVKLLVSVNNKKESEIDSIAMAVEKYFNDSHNKNEVKAAALIAAGRAFEQTGDDEKAMPCYVHAAKLLEDSHQWALLYIAYARWGWMLKVEPPFVEATAKLQIAEKYAKKLGDNNRMARVLGMQGWTMLFQHKYDEAHKLLDKAITIANSNDSPWLSWLYKSKASAFEMQANHSEALHYSNLAIAATKHPDKGLYGIKGTCFIGLGMYDSARVYIERGRLDNHYYEKATYYSELSDLEKGKGNLLAALQYKELFCQYVDSQYEEDRNKQLAQVARRYNYAIVAAERDNLKLANQRKTALVVALIGILCAIAAVFVYLHQRYRHRTENALRIKENLLQQTLSQLKAHNYELMKTQREAQDRQMELMASLSSKDEQIEQLRQQQSELKVKMLSNSDVIHKIEQLPSMNEKKKITSARNIALTSEEQQNLIDSTNVCYDNFASRLVEQFNDLSTDDVCLCCLLKLGVSAQDQGLLLNISDATLRTRKYRLKKKKMALSDEYETLNDFLGSF